MICSACTKVLEGKADSPRPAGEPGRSANDSYSHHNSFRDLEVAASKQNCFLCSRLWSAIPAEQKALLSSWSSQSEKEKVRTWLLSVELHHHIRTGSIWWYFVFSGRLPFDLRLRHGSSFLLTKNGQGLHTLDVPTQLHSSQCSAPPNTSGTIGPLKTERPDPTPSLMQLHQWIRTCETTHSTCKPRNSREGWNPTRLLDVGACIGSSFSDKILLINTREAREELCYVTLSHCWGQARILRLESSTHSKLEAGFEIAALEKTFQEAIFITRAAGRRYLWIDSLCIWQDENDSSDWLYECSQMHKVYGHGAFNISAASAHDATEGLFLSDKRANKLYEEVDCWMEPGHTERPFPTRYTLYDPTLWAVEIEQAPLNQRGWVLQERMLANKVIHFTDKEFFWECRELRASESFPTGYDASSAAKPLKHLGGNDFSYKSHWAYDKWEQIVFLYSRCRLTRAEDRLVAISGLAKEIGGLVDDSYVAGMWHKTLHEDLFWWADNGVTRRAQPYVAPTWSWASVPGGVFTCAHERFTSRLDVVDYVLQYVTEDTTGPITEARITVRGRLRPIEVVKREPIPYLICRTDTLDHATMELGLGGKKLLCARFASLEGYPDSINFDYIDLDYESESRNGRLFCISGRDAEAQFATHWTSGFDEYFTPADMHCMILLRCEDAESATYSRVGLSRHRRDSTIKEALGSGGEALDTITII